MRKLRSIPEGLSIHAIDCFSSSPKIDLKASSTSGDLLNYDAEAFASGRLQDRFAKKPDCVLTAVGQRCSSSSLEGPG